MLTSRAEGTIDGDVRVECYAAGEFAAEDKGQRRLI
jgi:hypothetical protein